jgi:hypothetical protein
MVATAALAFDGRSNQMRLAVQRLRDNEFGSRWNARSCRLPAQLTE